MEIRIIVYLFIILSFLKSYGQDLKVLNTKYAYKGNNQVIKKNSFISINNKVLIKKDGHLILQNNTGWSFYLKEGFYELDSCYKILKESYHRYDSLKPIIDSVFPDGINCKFNSVCLNDSYNINRQDLNYSYGNIAFVNTINENLVVGTESDTITVKWRDPKKEVKKYYLIIENLSEEIIDYNVTGQNQILIDLNDYSQLLNKEEPILLTIVSEDCRRSSKILIMKK